MSGPEHYAEAERLLDGPNAEAYSDMAAYDSDRRDNLAAAQVHATLALVAATAQGVGDEPGNRLVLPENDWYCALFGDAS